MERQPGSDREKWSEECVSRVRDRQSSSGDDNTRYSSKGLVTVARKVFEDGFENGFGEDERKALVSRDRRLRNSSHFVVNGRRRRISSWLDAARRKSLFPYAAKLSFNYASTKRSRSCNAPSLRIIIIIKYHCRCHLYFVTYDKRMIMWANIIKFQYLPLCFMFSKLTTEVVMQHRKTQINMLIVPPLKSPSPLIKNFLFASNDGFSTSVLLRRECNNAWGFSGEQVRSKIISVETRSCVILCYRATGLVFRCPCYHPA